MTSTKTDPIIVAGAGHVGLIAAIALAQSFDNVISLGVLPEGSDKRTTALMVPAIKFLEKIGLWESIEPHAAPIATMRILDGTNRLIRSPAVTFEASEIDEPAFGYNIPNVTLTSVLSDALKNSKVKHVAASATHYHPAENAIAVEGSDGSMYSRQYRRRCRWSFLAGARGCRHIGADLELQSDRHRPEL